MLKELALLNGRGCLRKLLPRLHGLYHWYCYTWLAKRCTEG
jgi:hypothetical protein